MTNDTLVSIITPTYNHEKFIGQCIESVLAQTYPHWEQIIIDDGSTDRTKEIVTQYKDDRIKYVKQDNIGIWRLHETYNKALSISQGTLIAVLEGDDFWPPDKLEKQIPAFDRSDIVLSWGKFSHTNRNGRILDTNPKNFTWFENRSRDEVLRKLLLQNFITACTVMCRKDALLSIGGFHQPSQALYVDYPTWLELSLVGEFKPVSEVLGFYRRHEDQISFIWMMEMEKVYNQCAVSFFQRLPETTKTRIGLSTQKLNDEYGYIAADMHFYFGRRKLVGHQWSEARDNFGQAMHQSTPFIQVKAFTGIVCSYLKLDMEWIAFLMGIPQLYDLG
jgi:glycosyltransferase involved in cell wall biosynthesis